MERQFVTTVYLLWENKALLHLHDKFNKYLPPGGHLEEGETPEEAAEREVREETGLSISFLSEENIWIRQEKHCQSLLRPYACLLEKIDIPHQKSHEHIDFIYLAEPKNPEKNPLFPFQWLSLSEIEKMDLSLFFPDTLKILRSLLKQKALF